MKHLIENIKDLKKSISEISVYDLNVYSSMELYYSIAKKLNEVINELSRFEGVLSEEIIKQNEVLSQILNEGLVEEVSKKLQQWLNDGTLEEVINVSLFEDLNNKFDKILLDKKLSIRDFLATENDDTQALIKAGQSKQTVVFDIDRELNISGVIPLHEGTKFIGQHTTLNVDRNTSFKFSRKNKFVDFTININDTMYNNSLFEISTDTITKYGENELQHDLQSEISGIDINNNFEYNTPNVNGEIFLVYATSEDKHGNAYIQKGFWNLKVSNINFRGYMRYFCRNYVDNRTTEGAWITDIVWEKIVIFSALYGYFGSISEDTLNNLDITDMECLYKNVSMQCWKSKNMFLFTSGNKSLHQCISWDWQYALKKDDGNNHRPIMLQNRGNHLHDYSIYIDRIYPEYLVVFDVLGMKLDTPQMYDYVKKSVSGGLPITTKTTNRELIELPNKVAKYKIADFKIPVAVNTSLSFKLHHNYILGYKGVDEVEFKLNLFESSGTPTMRMFCKGWFSPKDGYAYEFYYRIINGRCEVYMSVGIGSSNLYFENDTFLTSRDREGNFVNCYPQEVSSIPSATRLNVINSNVISVINNFNDVKEELKTHQAGLMIFDTTNNTLNIKISDYDSVWKKVTLS